MKKEDPTRYEKLQTSFCGNLTAMQNHIEQMGDSHYKIYKAHYKEHGIPVNLHAVPKREEQPKEG